MAPRFTSSFASRRRSFALSKDRASQAFTKVHRTLRTKSERIVEVDWPAMAQQHLGQWGQKKLVVKTGQSGNLGGSRKYNPEERAN
jgi:hypothetical protein